MRTTSWWPRGAPRMADGWRSDFETAEPLPLQERGLPGGSGANSGPAYLDDIPLHKGDGDSDRGPGQPDPPPKERRLRFANFADMGFDGALLTLVKGLVGDVQTVVLFGDSGSGKSLIALAMGMSVARGVPFCSRKTRQGFVAYLSPEGGSSIALR